MSVALESSSVSRQQSACDACNDLLVNPSSRGAIISGDEPFQYRRLSQDFAITATSGCILCQMILDRHNELGPKHTEEIGCPPDCQWFTLIQPSELVCLISRVQDRRHSDGTLSSLEIRGVRRQHSVRRGAHEWKLDFDVVSEDGSLLNSLVPHKPPEINVASTQSHHQARKWINECLECHTECQETLNPTLPVRLIDVGKIGEDPKLHVSEPDEHGSYVALSYCWGGPQSSQTTKSCLVSYISRIGLQSLPQSLKDAIYVTRELGIRYLWVDSICIIQDDEADKLRELSTMRLIYRNALVTISAASAERCTEGFLNIRSRPNYPVRLYSSEPSYEVLALRCHHPNSSVSFVNLTPNPLFHLDSINDPIIDRAWTLQESLLSTRMLIYHKTQLLWRCRTRFETTGGHLSWALFADRSPLLALVEDPPIDKDKDYFMQLAPGVTAILFGDDAYIENPDESTPNVADSRGLSLSRAQREWLRLIFLYTRRQMSNATDVFPAIAGIAEEFHNLTSESYCAGLWLQHFPVGLAWRRDMNSKAKRARPWRAPSWSWASVEGAIDYDLTQSHWNHMQLQLTTHHVAISRSPEQPRFGQIVGAEATLEGSLRVIEIEPILDSITTVSGNTRLTVSQFADVYIIDPSQTVIDGSRRCGTAILDEPIERVPFTWSPPAGVGTLCALTIFCSSKWSKAPVRPDRRVRMHGILIARLSDGRFTRIGWFNTFAFTMAEAEEVWVSRDEWAVIKLV